MLRNRLGITRVRDMGLAESQALLLAQARMIEEYSAEHRFTAADVMRMHLLWLGPIYVWAGEYRQVNIGKSGFQFANAQLIPRLMADLERRHLARYTPCRAQPAEALAQALAIVHAELILIHPFREGNGRLARLLAVLMGLQAGLPPLDFTPLSGHTGSLYRRNPRLCRARLCATNCAIYPSYRTDAVRLILLQYSTSSVTEEGWLTASRFWKGLLIPSIAEEDFAEIQSDSRALSARRRCAFALESFMT